MKNSRAGKEIQLVTALYTPALLVPSSHLPLHYSFIAFNVSLFQELVFQVFRLRKGEN